MEFICNKNHGLSLSATQIGVPLKMFIIKQGKEYDNYINCHYEGVGSKIKSIEGCLSLNKNQRFEVERYYSIIAKGLKLEVEDSGLKLLELNCKKEGVQSIIFQHEVDHCDFLNRIDEKGIEINF